MKRIVLAYILLFPSTLSAAEPLFTQDRKVTLSASREFSGLGKDFSGAAYDKSSDRFLIIDDSCKIFEMSYRKNWIEHERTLRLKGLKDCEDVTVLADGRVAVTEERRGNLALFTPDKDGAQVDCGKDCKIMHVDDVQTLTRKNAGLEALASNGTVLYVGKEERPRKFYRLTFQNRSFAVQTPWDAEKLLPEKSDMAGMAFFEGSLFILDQRNETIRQVNPSDGKILSSFTLPHFNSPLHQYEGIALVRRGKDVEMLVASEKNEIQVYKISAGG